MSQPLFAHQVEALRRLKEIEDEEFLGRTIRRKRKLLETTDPSAMGAQVWRTEINWFKPTFLVEWSRGVAGVRIPFVHLTSVAKTDVPRSADGRTHPRYPDQRKVAEGHFGYIERQYRADRTHLDYIERDGGRDVDEDGKYSHVLTNIHRNPAKRREFIRSVEQFEQRPHAPRLKAWSSDIFFWETSAALPSSPDWVRSRRDNPNCRRKR